jgi:hypothetical protein
MIFATVVAAAFLLGSIGYCARALHAFRRQAFASAKSDARRSLVVSVLSAPLMVAATLLGGIVLHGDESRATALARGISDSMNIGSFHVLVMISAGIVWVAARRRLSKSSTDGRPSHRTE